MNREARQVIAAAVRRLTGSGTGEPAPLDGLRAALAVQAEANAAAARYARAAREAGLSWEQIGQVVYPGAAPEGAVSKAEAAFARFASQYDQFTAPSFTYTCPACAGLIRDRGPGLGEHPADNEPGHKSNCTRLAALASEWEKQW